MLKYKDKKKQSKKMKKIKDELEDELEDIENIMFTYNDDLKVAS